MSLSDEQFSHLVSLAFELSTIKNGCEFCSKSFFKADLSCVKKSLIEATLLLSFSAFGEIQFKFDDQILFC